MGGEGASIQYIPKDLYVVRCIRLRIIKENYVLYA